MYQWWVAVFLGALVWPKLTVARFPKPSQLLAEFLGVVAHGARGVVRLIGIYSQVIHDFFDGCAFVMNEPIAARRSVLTPICRPVELHVDGYASFVDFKFATGPHCPECGALAPAASSTG